MSVTRMCQLAFIALLIALSGKVHGEPIDFVTQVRPILQQHCYACHGVEKQKSGLRLDIKSEAFKGGDNYGPSIVARSIPESPLVELITAADSDVRMPPDGESLSEQEITTLTTWIAEGANWPDGVDLAVLEDRRDHWSFKPLTQPILPSVQNIAWLRGEIDAFILAELEQANLQPAPEVDRLTWLRRVSLDLVGLPPTIEQILCIY